MPMMGSWEGRRRERARRLVSEAERKALDEAEGRLGEAQALHAQYQDLTTRVQGQILTEVSALADELGCLRAALEVLITKDTPAGVGTRGDGPR